MFSRHNCDCFSLMFRKFRSEMNSFWWIQSHYINHYLTIIHFMRTLNSFLEYWFLIRKIFIELLLLTFNIKIDLYENRFSYDRTFPSLSLFNIICWVNDIESNFPKSFNQSYWSQNKKNKSRICLIIFFNLIDFFVFLLFLKENECSIVDDNNIIEV